MKTPLTVADFCDKHDACAPGRKWAIENCLSMQGSWEKSPDPAWVVWMATRPGVLSHKELILFAAFCGRQNEHLLTGQRSKDAITIAEKFANGEATQEESASDASAAWADAAAAWAAWAAAWAAIDAVSDAASAAAWAASAAAWAASAAAWAAIDAASDAASDALAASDAARAAWAARDSARAYAAREKAKGNQASWLRENTHPDFS